MNHAMVGTYASLKV